MIHYFNSLALIFVLFICPSIAQPVWSQESGDNGKRLQKLEEENKTLHQMVEQLQKRLERLEAKDGGEEKKSTKKKASGKESKDQEKTETTQPEAEKKSKGKSETWLPSRIGERFRLGGRYQLEFFNPEEETLLRSARTEAPGGSFQTDELRIYLDADFKNDIRFHGAYDFQQENSGLIEAYVDFENLPFQSELRFGLQPHFFRPSRYTENYPLSGIAYWRNRDMGITWKGDYETLYTYLSVLNGTQLDDRRINSDGSARAISGRAGNLDLSGGKEFLAGAGLKYDFKNLGSIDLLGFGLTGDLSDDDIDFLQSDVPGYGLSFSDNRHLTGFNLEYDIDNWDFFAQAMTGRNGAMDRSAWYAELSYKFEFEGLRYLNSIRPLARYGELDIDLLPLPYAKDGSSTWDRQQWLFGVISELTRNVNFRAEYALNDEDTGDPDIQNNELLFQLEVSF